MAHAASLRFGVLALALAAWCAPPPLAPSRVRAAQSPTNAVPPAEASQEDLLLRRVREHIEQERQLLEQFAYREKRTPVRVSRLGKVSLGEPQVFEVYPSGDPDRPRRVLLEVAGRPASADEREEYARRYESRPPRTGDDRARRAAAAEARVEDAFRVFRFEIDGSETKDGHTTRVVRVVPRPDAQTKSDVGKWMKKFQGRAWVSEADQQLVRVEMVAMDTIYLGWGFVGRIAEGTKLTYTRQPVADGTWFPASARFELQGRTLLFRSFDVDTTTQWFAYKRIERARSVPTGLSSLASP